MVFQNAQKVKEGCKWKPQWLNRGELLPSLDKLSSVDSQRNKNAVELGIIPNVWCALLYADRYLWLMLKVCIATKGSSTQRLSYPVPMEGMFERICSGVWIKIWKSRSNNGSSDLASTNDKALRHLRNEEEWTSRFCTVSARTVAKSLTCASYAAATIRGV